MLLNRAGSVRPPLVYVAIGLPERLARAARASACAALYARALASSAAVARVQRARGRGAPRLARRGTASRRGSSSCRSGSTSRPSSPSTGQAAVDVVSVGADPHRDVGLFLRVAADDAEPHVSPRHARPIARAALGVAACERRGRDRHPVRRDAAAGSRRRASSRLPVLENSYSGATTVLLQAMALGKPVVVTRTKAIATGYGLVDGENCRLVPPGDEEVFERALKDVLRDDWRGRALGAGARRAVEDGLTWTRYVDRIEGVLLDATERRNP